VPAPLLYHPHHGLYLVNPGPDEDTNPTLQRFTNDGQRLYCVSLTEKLNLENPFSFLATRLFVDNSGNLSLLASLSYNANLDRDENFIMAHFDSQGNLSEIIKMDEFIGGHPIFRSKQGYLWTYRTEYMSTYWYIYNPKGELEQRIQAANNCILLPNGRLLALEGDKATLYSKSGKNFHVQIKGLFEIGDVMISGKGNFFGILTYPDDEYKERSDGYLEQSMIIQLCYFNPALSTLFILGKQNLKPNIFDSEDIPRYFEYYDHDLMSFDEDGNFYFIARYGPKQPYIRVFRMPINPETMNSIKKQY
jgi:hypothetical protein